MKKSISVLALSLCIAASASAQTALPEMDAYKVKTEAFSNSKVPELSEFMTDWLGPRLAASKQKLRAEEQVVAKLKEMGFKNVRVEQVADFEKGGWDNERTYAAMTAPYYCNFAVNPLAWTDGTNGLVKGECVVVDVKEAADLEKYKGQLAGKIVLRPIEQEYELSFQPMAKRYDKDDLAEMKMDTRLDRPDWSRWRGRGGNRQLVAATDSMIKAEGAIAVVRGGGTFNIPQSRGARYKVGQPKPLAEIIVPIEDHSRMVRLANKGQKVEMEIDVKNTFTDNQHINNIYAEIPGTDPKKKNEVVLIGAHLDSWHGGTGASDNASGCIVMMEALRILHDMGFQPKRTIRLALWGGEEQGLYGSRAYAKQLCDIEKGTKKPGYDDFVLYLNMDNGSGRYRGIHIEENDMARPFFKTWGKAFADFDFKTISPSPTGSTDHVSFNSIGLPAYQFIQDPLDYFRTYHTPMDTYERLSLDDLEINAAITAWLAACAANDDARIPVKPGYPKPYKSPF